MASDSSPNSSRMRGAERQRPGRVDPAAERRQHTQAPVADLVAEALDHDRPVAGHHAGGVALLAQERGEVRGRALVEVVALGQLGGILVHGLPRERSDCGSKLLRPPHALAAPERHRPGGAGGRGDDHAVARDLLDPPGGGAEEEGLARARLVDHLLVQLAHPAARRGGARRRGRGRGSCRRWSPRADVLPCGHESCPPPGPRRCADAAPRTPRRGSGRRACRARCRAVRAIARRRGRRAGSASWTAGTLSSSSAAVMATICWASTSSGLRGTTVGSMSPSRMRLATTAHSSRSARNFGKMRPRETSPTLWPARPMRCRPAVTDLGDSTWITRSTAPMSIPSSSDEVATRQGSSPT